MSTCEKNKKRIFGEAAALGTAAERNAYLAEVCGSDTALRTRILALLKARDNQNDLLKQFNPGTKFMSQHLSETCGTVIGRYKLLEKIGEGGMAVVYMAQQEQPIRRQVALKIIKVGMDTQQVIARFEAERQALALMDHPHVAKVLDAGATETGRPYFVMELVKGLSITKYCDKHELSTKKRLDLFIQVCNAVQHAHQKGIIHRDIKPPNVMVTQRDGTPLVKVIDFGIAKATNQRLTEKTLFTRYAQIIGTPAYMSPEQAEFGELDIDTRTDIYSLGILLYELLTGQTPFSEERLRRANYLEMQRVIREEEPTKPSTKLSTLGAILTEIAKHRRVTPGALRRLIQGDLDWIVMKSLDKDRTRRYDTTRTLALDIQRHLDNEPVLARAPSITYRVQKFLRRYRVGVVAVLALAVLIGSLVMTLSTWNKNQVQRHRSTLSEAHEARAKGDPDTALKIVEPILNNRHVGSEAQLLYADILAEKGQPDEARTILESLLNERPEIANAAHLLLTKIYWENDASYEKKLRKERGQRDETMAMLENLLGEHPKIANAARSLLSRIYWEDDTSYEEELHNMVELYTHRIKADSEDAESYLQRAQNYYYLHEREEFLGDMDKYVAILGLSAGRDSHGSWMQTFLVGLWHSTRTDLGPNVNSPYQEAAPTVSSDGLSLFFVSDQAGGQGSGDIWVTTRAIVSDVWTSPVNLGEPVNSPFNDGGMSISPDGLSLYFASNRPGGSGSQDIWVSTRASKDDPWDVPESLGAIVNAASFDWRPSISSDGLSLFFDSDRAGGSGGSDIWVARRETPDHDWRAPENLGPVVNSSSGDGAVSISADGLALFFISDRPGGYGQADIWVTWRSTKDDPWGKPINLGPTVNTPFREGAPSISTDRSELYFDKCTGPQWDRVRGFDLWKVIIAPVTGSL